ncbi:MAG: hypothetical protein OD918_08585 [Gammaproteobacteria bacterium]
MTPHEKTKHYQNVTDPKHVVKAIKECDRMGREAFLGWYGYGEAKTHFLLCDDAFERKHCHQCKYKRYDSKAILGVAHKFAHESGEALKAVGAGFKGGENTVKRHLEKLGFTVGP